MTALSAGDENVEAELKTGRHPLWEHVPDLILAVAGIGVIGPLALWMWNRMFGGNPESIPLIPGGYITLLGVAATTYVVSKVLGASQKSTDAELKSVRAERKDIENQIATRLDISNVVRLGLNHITEYYAINKSQARNSFTASMVAVIIGLAALVSGIVFYRNYTTVATLSAVSGVLLQFIGGAYFYLYNRSLQQLNFFYETLVRLQDTMLAIQQVDLLGETGREKAREAIIRALIRAPINSPRIVESAVKSHVRRSKGNATAAAD
jgi:hypothetical protein